MREVKPAICQLVHGLPVGGAEILIDRFVRHFSSDYRIVVVCLDQVGELGKRLQQDGFQVELLGRRPGFDWGCVRRLIRMIRSERIRLLHTHQCTPFAYALATRALGAKPRVLLTEHGRFFPDYPSWKRKCFHRVATRRGDRFVAVGQAVRSALINNEGLPAERVEVIYNGVNLARMLAPQDRATTRRRLGVAEDDFLVLQVARLDPIKDHLTALAAVDKARQACPKLRLMLVGDGPERERIEASIADRRLGDKVRMLGSRNDVPELLAAADAFLLTSVSEGIPVTLIEAMMAGVPIASTAVGGVPEVIEHGRSGLLAPAGDAAGLANALARLCNEPATTERFIAAARTDAETRFGESSMFDAYGQIYEAMIGVTAQTAHAPMQSVSK